MANIEKIYEITLAGEQELLQKMDAVNKSFDTAKRNFKEVKAASKGVFSNQEELDKEKAAMEKVTVELLKQQTEAKKLRAEKLALQNAGRALTNEELKQQAATMKSYEAYQKLSRQYSEAKKNALGIGATYGVNSVQFQKASAEAQKYYQQMTALNKAVGDFKLNVGNYPKTIELGGISNTTLKSLQDSGLGQVIASQVNQAKSKVTELDNQLAGLKNQLNSVKQTGQAGFENIEREIIKNRQEAELYREEISRISAEMKGAASIGENFSNTIKQNFADMKGQMVQFALGYVSFQAAMNVGTRIKNDVIAFDSYNQSLEKASARTGDFARNQQFAEETAERLGLKLLDTGNSFKSFFTAYTESGGGAQQAREIYESAAEAAAELKLSQEQANGMMLAFSQIASKGKVQAEELRGQIGERVPGAFGIAAKAMGMTTAELDKMMADGKLLAQDFLPKFAAELRKTFGNGGKEVKGLQAELNRLDNMIAKVGSNKSFIQAVSLTVEAIIGLVRIFGKIPFSVWLSFIGFLTLAYWANVKAIAANTLALGAYIVRMGVGNALIATATVLETAHAVVLGIVNGGYVILIGTLNLMGVSTVRLRAIWASFNAMLLGTPLGLVIGLLAAVGAATYAYASSTENATAKLNAQGKALKENAAQLRVTNEVTKQGSETVSGQIGLIERLTATINNNTVSNKSKKQALEELIAINPKYLEGLTLENFHTAQGTQILEDYKNKLLEVAKAKAAAALYEQKAKQLFELEFSLADKKRAKAEADKYKNNVFDKRSWGEFGRGIGGMLGLGEGDAEDQLNNTISGIQKLKGEVSELGKIMAGNQLKGIDPNDPILGGSAGGSGGGVAAGTLAALREEIKMLNAELDAATIGSKRYFEIQTKLRQKQAYLDSLTKPPGKGKLYRGSRLTGQQRDFLKDLEADRDRELAIIETAYNKAEIAEEDYIRRSLTVNMRYYDRKIAYLKSGNAEERKQEARAILDKIKAESEANDKLYAIYKKRYDNELKLAEQTAQDQLDQVQNNPYSTDSDILTAKTAFYDQMTSAQIVYNQKMIDLEIKLSKSMIDEAASRGRALQQKLDEENRNTLRARMQRLQINLRLSQEVYEEVNNANEINAAVEKRTVLENKRLTQQQRRIELERIAMQLELNNINSELGSVTARVSWFEIELQNRKLTNDEMREYNRLLRERAVLEGKKGQQETDLRQSGYSLPTSSAGSLNKLIGDRFKNSDGVMVIGKDANGNDVDGSELFGQILAQSYDIASSAMNNYFDAERQRIEESKRLAYERIDLETQQSLRYAQSKAEEDAINKESQQKKKQADKEAGQRLKALKKQELKIALATQLANIGVAAAQNPLNGVTFGAAGIAMYAALAALAFGQYLTNLSAVNATQFGRGGLFGNKKSYGRGGRLFGPSHDDNNGMPVIDPRSGNVAAYVEGGEAIINKHSMADKNRYTVSGTPSQIASRINALGGGVDWFGGATLSKFASGGIFNWNRTHPPVFRSQLPENQPGAYAQGSGERLERIEQSLEALAGEATKKVVLNPNEVTSYQKEKTKQTEIGTL